MVDLTLKREAQNLTLGNFTKFRHVPGTLPIPDHALSIRVPKCFEMTTRVNCRNLSAPGLLTKHDNFLASVFPLSQLCSIIYAYCILRVPTDRLNNFPKCCSKSKP